MSGCEVRRREEENKKKRRKVRYLAIGVVFFVVGVAVAVLVANTSRVGAQVGKPAPEFAVPGLSGGTVALSAYRGRPVVINFLATWCGPCWRELPDFEEAAEEYQDRGLVVVGVDVRDSTEAIRRMVSNLGLAFPIGLDPTGEVAIERYRIPGLPVTVFVDRRGVVRKYWTGPIDRASLDRFIAMIL